MSLQLITSEDNNDKQIIISFDHVLKLIYQPIPVEQQSAAEPVTPGYSYEEPADPLPVRPTTTPAPPPPPTTPLALYGAPARTGRRGRNFRNHRRYILSILLYQLHITFFCLLHFV